jgi:hypothetical protein
MPNHITNIVSFKGDKKQIELLIKHVQTEQEETDFMGKPVGRKFINYFDFNKIIPQPDNIFTGNLGEKERQMCEEKGIPNWYDWNIENWGTKWNSYSSYIEDNVITFDTAWSCPEPVFRKLSKMFPKVEIKVEFADEDIGSNCGILTCKNGRVAFEDRQGDDKFAYGVKGWEADEDDEDEDE